MTAPLRPTDGVLLVAHGTVANLADLPEFLSKIRRGRPASPELIRELRHRYEVIGGSPLLEVTESQARALEKELGRPVLVGMRLWKPSVEEALADAAARGIERLCVLPLAPFSVHVYADAARRSLDAVRGTLPHVPELVDVRPWGTLPSFVRAYAERIAPVLAEAPDATLLLTAHSLPAAVIRAGDPYAEQVRGSAEAIAAELGRPFEFAYQSQGADGGEWLGPDVRATLERLQQRGVRDVVVAPIGFLSDHVETLYDLDVEAAGWAKELGLGMRRVRALNDDAAFIVALAEIARSTLAN